MNTWNQVPLFRLILPFLFGILLAYQLKVNIPVGKILFSIGLLALSAMVLLTFLKTDFKRIWVFGVLLNICLFLGGYERCMLLQEKYGFRSELLLKDQQAEFHVKISSAPIEKKNSVKLILDIIAVKHPEKWEHSLDRALVYLAKDNNSLSLQYGDELIIHTKLSEIKNPGNPSEFNYKAFLDLQGIHLQTYLKSSEWTSLGRNSGNRLVSSSIALRDVLLGQMAASGITDHEFSVGAALLLGYSDKLDPEIIASYSATGALHVLSVSGLHVAIVYIVFHWLLGFLDKFKYGHIVKAVLLIFILWFYAAITGLSPSVLRAATMFSFIVVARSFKWRTNIYNTLAASAFLLLLIDPLLLMQVGFQLSYIAVLGIVYLQPRIHALLSTGNCLGEQLWAVTSVSIAAQIATFPLGLYYFHQFPNYFLLSNLIVIPVSTMIIYLGISFLVFSKVSVLSAWLAAGFSWSVWFLNISVKKIEEIPGAVSDGISISSFETLIAYVIIFLVCGYFAGRRYFMLQASLAFIVFFLFLQIIEQYREAHQKQLVIYNIPKSKAIDIIYGKKNYVITDTCGSPNRYMEQYWWERGIEETALVREDTSASFFQMKNNFLSVSGKKIVLLDDVEQLKGKRSEKKFNADILLISGNAVRSIKEAENLFKPSLIVFDASNATYKIEKWKRECEERKLSYYSIPEKGAFCLDLD